MDAIQVTNPHVREKPRPWLPWHAAITFLLLASTLAASRLAELRKPDALARGLDTIDRQIAGFTGSDNPPLGDRELASLLPTQYLSRSYSNPGGLQMDLFVAYYAQQRAGENMHSPTHCLPGSGWEIWNYGSAVVPINSRPVKINKYSISHGQDRMLVLYWYQSRERIIASEYLGKVLLARDALMRNSTAGSIVRIVLPDRPGALEQGLVFAGAVIPQMQRCFGD